MIMILIISLSLNVYTQNVPNYVPTNGLIGWYPFNGNANDESGNGNNGIVNLATLTTDRFSNDNSAYDFNGKSSEISIPSLNNIAYKPATYHVWINPDSLNKIVYPQGGGIVLVGREQCMHINQGNLAIFDYPEIGVNNEISYYTGAECLYSKYTPTLNQWTCITMTVSSQDTVKFYINGKFVKSEFLNTNCGALIPFKIGAGTDCDGVSSRFLFNGKLDDVGIWDRTLTPCEIYQLYKGSISSTSSSITETACGSYTAPDGQVYTTSGIKTAIIPNYVGCDSTITINLTINTVDISVTQNEIILTANATADYYQWLDCNNNYSFVNGETSQSFTATQNGSYAVKLTKNNCTDTSTCYEVTTVGILENTFSNNIKVYPNLTDGMVKIDLGETLSEFVVSLNDVNGKLIRQSTYKNTKTIELKLNVQPGIYLLKIYTPNNKATIRFIKN